ncbi:MAG: hypothetical protein Fur0020_06900 [Thermodesulfovibrionia bacterium]
MSIRCPYCGNEYDVSLFGFNRVINCVCGNTIKLEHREFLNEEEHQGEEDRIMEIKSLADRIAFLIVSTDYPEIDITIEKERLRERIEELFPDRAYLYDLIYEPRFQRLFRQFRRHEDID